MRPRLLLVTALEAGQTCECTWVCRRKAARRQNFVGIATVLCIVWQSAKFSVMVPPRQQSSAILNQQNLGSDLRQIEQFQNLFVV